MNDRQFWVSALQKISDPVLRALSEGRLKQTLPLDFHPDRASFAPLEAFGRTLCGIAPWLSLKGLTGAEAETQARFIVMAQTAMDHATDPTHPDFLNFCVGDGKSPHGQPLVDAAFLSHAIIRSPDVLYTGLDARVKKNLVNALQSTRVFKPAPSNWLFFTAMIETALYIMGADYRPEAIDAAIRPFTDTWYKGDGTYGDGHWLHWDYYNSFVIQPMLVDILRSFAPVREDYASLLPTVLRRASRYAAIQEQMIGADGTYTVFGRSVTYRFGAFHLLSQAALQDFLPPSLTPGRVRAALTAVIGRVMSHPDTFDENGWLRPGVYGYQPSLAEPYINIGSLYLCTFIFPALGLSPDAPFWTSPAESWTAKKLWKGEDLPADHAVD